MSDIITGNDLIDMGFTPAPWFGEALEEINRRSLSRSQAARYASARLKEIAEAEAAAEAERLAREIPLRESPLAYQVNLTDEDGTEAERANVQAVKTTFDALMRTPTLEAGAIMPDACPAGPVGTIPVGGVVAARGAIHPGFHSADICCSVFATVFDKAKPAEVLDAIHGVTHFGPGGRKRDEEFPLPKVLRDRFSQNAFLRNGRILSRARSDLGTQGDGNHFAFVGRSEATGKTVLITHHGSRGPGALLYKAGMKVAEEHRAHVSPETLPGNAWIPSESKEGRAYWEALQIIRRWTKLNHQVLHDAALAELGDDIADRLWNEHNFVFREDDGGQEPLFWHAKGATPIHNPLLPDTAGVQIVPLNMAQPVLFVSGTRHDGNLGFAPHGAGRNLSRTQHKRLHDGRSHEEIFAEETAGIDARFFCGQIDISELPSAYKDANRVQSDMTRFGLADVVDRIQPFGAIMAGDWDRDAPWKKKARAKETSRPTP